MPPGVACLLVFIGPDVGVLNSFFAREMGNSPIKNCQGILPKGGMVSLGID